MPNSVLADIASNPYILGPLLVIAAAFSIFLLHETRKLRAVTRILANQQTVASPHLRAELIQYASSLGKEQLARQLLRRIEELHGKGHVRIGHVMWVMKVLEGEIAPDATPPSFKPKGAEIPVSIDA